VINDTVKKDGKIIIPAFSIGRTQDIIYTISEIRSQNRIPDIPVFIDSPLSVNATGIFKNHPECFDTETAELIKNGVNIWNMDNILYIKEAEESKMLNSYNGPCIIVSASGMCENGRILHHLANNIENQNSTILIIGFMAQNTLGRKLVEARDKANAEVNIFGKPYKINAEIKVLNAFSAHADKNEILDYVKNFKSEKLKKIFLVHGEEDAQTALKESLLNSGFNNIEIPKRGDEISINN
jgi:metallo-beta-lactamase family protein